MLKVDRDKIDGSRSRRPSARLQFAKADGEWQMAAPCGTRGLQRVEGLVSRLNTLQMKSIVAPRPRTRKYGLDKPAATVRDRLRLVQATLLLGKAAGEGTVYAKDQSRPAVFTIESTRSPTS